MFQRHGRAQIDPKRGGFPLIRGLLGGRVVGVKPLPELLQCQPHGPIRIRLNSVPPRVFRHNGRHYLARKVLERHHVHIRVHFHVVFAACGEDVLEHGNELRGVPIRVQSDLESRVLHRRHQRTKEAQRGLDLAVRYPRLARSRRVRRRDVQHPITGKAVVSGIDLQLDDYRGLPAGAPLHARDCPWRGFSRQGLGHVDRDCNVLDVADSGIIEKDLSHHSARPQSGIRVIHVILEPPAANASVGRPILAQRLHVLRNLGPDHELIVGLDGLLRGVLPDHIQKLPVLALHLLEVQLLL